MYTEVTAMQEGYWYSTITVAGAWELTETLTLSDTADGQTLARVDAWWTRPAPQGASFTAVETYLREGAAKGLKRIADRVKVDPATEASDGSI
jgi:hypothetical protein